MPFPSRRDILRASGVSLVAIAGCSSQNKPTEDATTVAQTTGTRTTPQQTQTTQKTIKKSLSCTLKSLSKKGWPLPDRDPANTNYASVAINPTKKPSIRWQQRAAPPKSHENMRMKFTNPVVTDDRVFVGKVLLPSSHTEMPDKNYLHAYDRASGERIWTAPTGDEAPRTVTTKDDTIYVSTLDGVYAFRQSDGSNKWVFRPEDSVKSVTPVNRRIYVGGGSGSVTALQADGSIEWATTLSDRLLTSPAIYDGTVFAGTNDGRMTALRADDGQERWSKTFGQVTMDGNNSVQNLIVTSCGLLATIDGTVLALDPKGEVRWRVSGNHSSLSTDGENVYAGTTDGHLRMLSMDDGEVQWKTFLGVADSEMPDGILEDPVVTDESVFVSSRPGNIYSLNKHTGSKKWQLALDSLSHVGKPIVVPVGIFVSVGKTLVALA